MREHLLKKWMKKHGKRKEGVNSNVMIKIKGKNKKKKKTSILF